MHLNILKIIDWITELDGALLQRKETIVQERRKAIINEGFEVELDAFITLVREYIDMAKSYCSSDSTVAGKADEVKAHGDDLQSVCRIFNRHFLFTIL
jgi:hypothetical protein